MTIMTETKPQDQAKIDETAGKEERKEDDKDDEEAKIEAPGTEKRETKTKRDIPDVFYCPITKEIMTDPVVVPGGDSYEKSALVARGDVPSNKVYPNRALQSIIEGTVERNGDSMQAGQKRSQHSMRQNFSQLLEKSANPSMEYRALSDSYYCPITFGLIHDPVIDPEGNTYERSAITNWIGVNGTSPITRHTVSIEVLYPNHAIEELLEVEKCRSEGSIHPSIRKFREETPPSTTAPDPPGTTAFDPEVGESNPSSPPSDAAANNFPTTQAELDTARARNRRAACTFVGFILLLVCLFLAFGYGGMLFFIILLASCLVGNARNRRRNR
jgi:hypothetical protein